MQVQVPTAELLETLKRHGVQDPAAYRMLLSLAVDPDKDMLESFWNAVMPTVQFNRCFTSRFGKPTRQVDGEHRFAISENMLPVGVNSGEVHTLIVGASDTGKTVCQELIALSFMRKGHTVWLFVKADDVTRTIRAYSDIFYADLAAGSKCDLRLNLVRVLRKEVLIILFRDSFVVADGSEGYLLESLGELQQRNPDANIHDIYYFIKARKHGLRTREEGWQQSLLNRLSGILSSPLGAVFDCARGHEENIQQHNVIFNIGQLTVAQQKFLVAALINALYAANIRNGRCTY